jgi:hypothetical protein
MCAVFSSGGASIYDRILRHKAAVVEPRDAALFPESAALYRSKLGDGGAVFFAVCRCSCYGSNSDAAGDPYDMWRTLHAHAV